MNLRFTAAAAAAVMFVNAFSFTVSAEEAEGTFALAEAETGTIILESGADTVMPCGSLTKLMTALLAAEAVEDGKVSLDSEMTASAHANSLSGAEIWLVEGEKMSLGDLLKGAVPGNANDAACTIAENLGGSEEKFTEMMNNRAAELGMKGTGFADSTGLGNSVSAAGDMALLSCELLRHETVKPVFSIYLDYVRNGETQIVNTNRLVRTYEGCTGLKYSFSEESGYCAAVSAERDGKAFVAALLGYPDKDKLFAKARELLDHGFSAYSCVTPDAPEDFPDYITVKGGVSEKVRAAYDKNIRIVVPNGKIRQLDGYAAYPEYVYAPVKAGDKLGELFYYLDGNLVYRGEIRAKSNVKAKSQGFSLSRLLKYLFEF